MLNTERLEITRFLATLRNVTYGVKYIYYVTAVNEYGESEKSNEVSATPVAIMVPGFEIIVILVLIFLITLRKQS